MAISHRIIQQALVSNGYTLDPERLGWLTPSDPGEPMERLRAQYDAQGYLWLKGLLDRAFVLDFRARFFEAYRSLGLLAEGSAAVEGLYSGNAIDSQVGTRLLLEIVRWASYEAFCLAEPIWSFYEALWGEPVYLHKRKIIRYTTNAQKDSTGAHYDLTYLRAGTDRLATSWIPIGDIPVEMGGLIYLEGSDRWGRAQEAEFSRLNANLSPEERISAYNKNMSETGWLTKDLPSLVKRLDTRWLIADYEVGDMVVHSPYMIHAATTNLSQTMRLSTDIRYQPVREKIDPRWMSDWQIDDRL
ncbi:MAG TPA: phytanoyl-CoA dioxygenase family protein [Phototrophicaceae bacterium]|nr:phytanoyl-CoA dioxygenase family protein [Phototrophicaceae bacterium]